MLLFIRAPHTRVRLPFLPYPLFLPRVCVWAQGLIRKLEQQLGRARADLERLQCNNKMLQRKAVVLSKHSSFRRCTAGMLDELQAVRQ